MSTLQLIALIVAVFSSGMAGAYLYRWRGGPFKDDLGVGTQTARLLWCAPTAGLLAFAFGLWPVQTLWVALAQFLGLALIGHGAHMNINAEFWRANYGSHFRGAKQTELLTHWLPMLYRWQLPNASWPNSDIIEYHVIGMTIIGIARAAIWFGPLVYFGVSDGWWLIATGFFHGLAYWAAGNSQRGEFFVGFLTWASIVLVALT